DEQRLRVEVEAHRELVLLDPLDEVERAARDEQRREEHLLGLALGYVVKIAGGHEPALDEDRAQAALERDLFLRLVELHRIDLAEANEQRADPLLGKAGAGAEELPAPERELLAQRAGQHRQRPLELAEMDEVQNVGERPGAGDLAAQAHARRPRRAHLAVLPLEQEETPRRRQQPVAARGGREPALRRARHDLHFSAVVDLEVDGVARARHGRSVCQKFVLSARRRALRASARSMRRVTSSRGGMPLASHILGYIEIAVKPGMVLISFTSSSPSSRRKKSTRAIPLASSTWNARTAKRCTRSMSAGDTRAGIEIVAPCSSTYFASYE